MGDRITVPARRIEPAALYVLAVGVVPKSAKISIDKSYYAVEEADSLFSLSSSDALLTRLM